MSDSADLQSRSGRWSVRLRRAFEDYFGIDLRILALVRIAFGLIVLTQLAMFAGNIGEFLGDDGLFSPQQMAAGPVASSEISLHVLSGSSEWQLLLFGVHTVLALMLVVGYRTRVASVGTWVMTVSLFNGLSFMTHRADTLLCLMLLWGALIPWGARYSVDALKFDLRELPERVASLGTAGLIAQMPLVYFATFLDKLPNEAWNSEWSGVYYALFPEFVNGFGQFVATYQPEVVTRLLSGLTLLIQAVGPVLAFFPLLVFTSSRVRRRWLNRLRIGVFCGFAGFQMVLLATVAIGLFPVISMAAMLPLLPWFDGSRYSEVVEKWSRQVRESAGCLTRFAGTPSMPGAGNIVAAALVWLVSVASIVDHAGVDTGALHQVVSSQSRIVQEWGMFSSPVRGHRTYIVEAIQNDGESIDLFGDRGPVGLDSAQDVDERFPMPPRTTSLYDNYRWRLFFSRVHGFGGMRVSRLEGARHLYASYVCRSWNRHHDGEREVRTVRLFRLFDDIGPFETPYTNYGSTDSEIEKNLLWVHWCFEDDRREHGVVPEAPVWGIGQ